MAFDVDKTMMDRGMVIISIIQVIDTFKNVTEVAVKQKKIKNLNDLWLTMLENENVLLHCFNKITAIGNITICNEFSNLFHPLLSKFESTTGTNKFNIITMGA